MGIVIPTIRRKKDSLDKISQVLTIGKQALGLGLAIPNFIQEREKDKANEEYKREQLELQKRGADRADRSLDLTQAYREKMLALKAKKEAKKKQKKLKDILNVKKQVKPYIEGEEVPVGWAKTDTAGTDMEGEFPSRYVLMPTQQWIRDERKYTRLISKGTLSTRGGILWRNMAWRNILAKNAKNLIEGASENHQAYLASVKKREEAKAAGVAEDLLPPLVQPKFKITGQVAEDLNTTIAYLLSGSAQTSRGLAESLDYGGIKGKWNKLVQFVTSNPKWYLDPDEAAGFLTQVYHTLDREEIFFGKFFGKRALGTIVGEEEFFNRNPQYKKQFINGIATTFGEDVVGMSDELMSTAQHFLKNNRGKIKIEKGLDKIDWSKSNKIVKGAIDKAYTAVKKRREENKGKSGFTVLTQEGLDLITGGGN